MPRAKTGRVAPTPPSYARQHVDGVHKALPANLLTGALLKDKNPVASGGGRGLGRSHGGLTTKIHLAADRRCRPITRILSPGHHGDCPRFIPLMNQISIDRRGKGTCRQRRSKPVSRSSSPAI